MSPIWFETSRRAMSLYSWCQTFQKLFSLHHPGRQIDLLQRGHSYDSTSLIVWNVLDAGFKSMYFRRSYDRPTRHRYSWFQSILKKMLKWFPSSKLLLTQTSRFKLLKIKPIYLEALKLLPFMLLSGKIKFCGPYQQWSTKVTIKYEHLN
jgi:hypothetical protein